MRYNYEYILLLVFEENGRIFMVQTILVTGSTSGFGRLTVETLARQGYIVFAGMRAMAGKNAPAAVELRTLAEQEHLALHVVELDITDEDSAVRAIESIVGITGRLDVVVNNAGMSYIGPLEAFTLEQVQQQFDTNVLGVWRVNRAALPQMRLQGSGLLLQIGSVVGRLAFPFLGLYGATKFALEGLTEAYRYELAPFGIDAAIIEPGTYPTAISAKRQVAADTERFALYKTAIDGFMTPFFAENRSATPPRSTGGGRRGGKRHRPTSGRAAASVILRAVKLLRIRHPILLASFGCPDPDLSFHLVNVIGELAGMCAQSCDLLIDHRADVHCEIGGRRA
jgi:NAD(P)-dependent dehydrogenase (short-subunit alcohol dehydrogenase family)